jgi:hypothetical protein
MDREYSRGIKMARIATENAIVDFKATIARVEEAKQVESGGGQQLVCQGRRNLWRSNIRGCRGTEEGRSKEGGRGENPDHGGPV